MSANSSLDFLNMIKGTGSFSDSKKVAPQSQKSISNKPNKPSKCTTDLSSNKEAESQFSNIIAVIDTETNWSGEVMSIGIVLASSDSFKCLDSKYYLIDPEFRKGGMYSDVLDIAKDVPKYKASRRTAMKDICDYLNKNNVGKIFAYNAKFDHAHLEELTEFEWYDIMRLAAYTQFNKSIPADAELCKSGQLKRGYSVENILRMLSGQVNYCETHNAIIDAMDELKIMELLGHSLSTYDCAKL